MREWRGGGGGWYTRHYNTSHVDTSMVAEIVENPPPGVFFRGWYLASLTNVEGSSAVGLGEHHVGVALELAIEALEQVFEQQRDQLPGQLQSFVAVVVLDQTDHKGRGESRYRGRDGFIP